MSIQLQGQVSLDFTQADAQLNNFQRKLSSKDFSQPLGRISGDAAEFRKSLEAATARVTAFGLTAGAIYKVSEAIRAGARATIEVDKQLVELNTFLGQSKNQLEDFSRSLFKVARNAAVPFEAATEAAKEFARQGLSTNEVLKRTEDALTLARISGINYGDAVNGITTAINSFNKEALSSTDIINKLIAVDTRFAVSSAQLNEALTRVGSSAEESGISIDKLIATVTAAQQITGRGGAVIGNALKTIFTRLQRPEVLTQLQQLGISIKDQNGFLLDGISILKNYADATKNLSQIEKSRTAELIGGIYQINQVNALIKDLSSSNSVYANALRISSTATDEAKKKNEELNKSMSALLQTTKNQAQEAAAVLGKSMLEPMVRIGSEFTKNVLKLVNPESDLLGTAEKGGESLGTSFTKGVASALGKTLAAGGIPLAVGIGGTLLTKMAKFGVSSVRNISKDYQSIFSEKTLVAQERINDLLRQNPSLITSVQNKTMTLAQVEEKLLDLIRLQNRELAVQASIRARVVPTVVSKGGPSKIKAGGYIPNFAISAEQEEVATAKAYGAKNPVPRVIQATIRGKTGPVVVNNQEKIIPNFAGTRETAIIPNYRNIEDIPRMSSGYVPNFAQKISSAGTSLNQVPGLFKKFGKELGPRNIDIGGGKYDKGTNFLNQKFGINSRVYDPYNRSKKFNKKTLEDFFGTSDTATIANVLNVIEEQPEREKLLKFISKSIKSGGSAYFGIYEGNKSGIGAPTTKGYQRNLPADKYLEEISKYFDIKKKTGNYIVGSPLASGYIPNFSKSKNILGYHTTLRGTNFGSGIDSTKSFGEGQGQGFYFWKDKQLAKQHAEYLNSNPFLGGGSYKIVAGKFDKKFVVPDYEMHTVEATKFLKENPDLLSNLKPNLASYIDREGSPMGSIESARVNKDTNTFSVNISGNSGVSKKRSLSFDQQGGDIGTGNLLGPLFDALRTQYPEKVRAFEESLIEKGGKGFRYMGPKTKAYSRNIASGYVPNFAFSSTKSFVSGDRRFVDPETYSYLRYKLSEDKKAIDLTFSKSEDKGQGWQMFERLGKTAKRMGLPVRSASLSSQANNVYNITDASLARFGNNGIEQVLKVAFPQLIHRQKGSAKNTALSVNIDDGLTYDNSKVSGKNIFSIVAGLASQKFKGNAKLLRNSIIDGSFGISDIVTNFAGGRIPNFAKKDKYKFPSISSAEMEANISKNFEKISPENQKYFARAYEDYSNISKIFAQLSEIPIEKFVDVASALSPNNPVEKNFLDALRYGLFAKKQRAMYPDMDAASLSKMIASVPATTYNPNRRKAGDILSGIGLITGNKRKSFSSNIIDPFSSQDVTVDFRAQGDALGRIFTANNAPSMNREQYDKVAEAFRNVGARAGVSGLGVQAATWIGGRPEIVVKQQSLNRGILAGIFKNPQIGTLENLERLMASPKNAREKRERLAFAASLGITPETAGDLVTIPRKGSGYVPNFAGGFNLSTIRFLMKAGSKMSNTVLNPRTLINFASGQGKVEDLVGPFVNFLKSPSDIVKSQQDLNDAKSIVSIIFKNKKAREIAASRLAPIISEATFGVERQRKVIAEQVNPGTGEPKYKTYEEFLKYRLLGGSKEYEEYVDINDFFPPEIIRNKDGSYRFNSKDQGSGERQLRKINLSARALFTEFSPSISEELQGQFHENKNYGARKIGPEENIPGPNPFLGYTYKLGGFIGNLGRKRKAVRYEDRWDVDLHQNEKQILNEYLENANSKGEVSKINANSRIYNENFQRSYGGNIDSLIARELLASIPDVKPVVLKGISRIPKNERFAEGYIPNFAGGLKNLSSLSFLLKAGSSFSGLIKPLEIAKFFAGKGSIESVFKPLMPLMQKPTAYIRSKQDLETAKKILETLYSSDMLREKGAQFLAKIVDERNFNTREITDRAINKATSSNFGKTDYHSKESTYLKYRLFGGKKDLKQYTASLPYWALGLTDEPRLIQNKDKTYRLNENHKGNEEELETVYDSAKALFTGYQATPVEKLLEPRGKGGKFLGYTFKMGRYIGELGRTRKAIKYQDTWDVDLHQNEKALLDEYLTKKTSKKEANDIISKQDYFESYAGDIDSLILRDLVSVISNPATLKGVIKIPKEKRFAGGYIPNFAGLSDAIGREETMTGLPASQIMAHFDKRGNPIAVTNKKHEPNGLKDVVPNFALPKINLSGLSKSIKNLFSKAAPTGAGYPTAAPTTVPGAAGGLPTAATNPISGAFELFGIQSLQSIVDELAERQVISPGVSKYTNLALSTIPGLKNLYKAGTDKNLSKGGRALTGLTGAVQLGGGLKLTQLMSGDLGQRIETKKLSEEIDKARRNFQNLTENTSELASTLSKLDTAYKDPKADPREIAKLVKNREDILKKISIKNPELVSKLAGQESLTGKIDLLEENQKEQQRILSLRESAANFKAKGNIPGAEAPGQISSLFEDIINRAGPDLLKQDFASATPANFAEILKKGGLDIKEVSSIFNTDDLKKSFISSLELAKKLQNISAKQDQDLREKGRPLAEAKQAVGSARETREEIRKLLEQQLPELASFAGGFSKRAGISASADVSLAIKKSDAAVAFQNSLLSQLNDKEFLKGLPPGVEKALYNIEAPGEATAKELQKLEKLPGLSAEQVRGIQRLIDFNSVQTKDITKATVIAEETKKIQLKFLALQEKAAFGGDIRTSINSQMRAEAMNAGIRGPLTYQLGGLIGSKRSQVAGATDFVTDTLQRYPGLLQTKGGKQPADIEALKNELTGLNAADMQKDLLKRAGMARMMGLGQTASLLQGKAFDQKYLFESAGLKANALFESPEVPEEVRNAMKGYEKFNVGAARTAREEDRLLRAEEERSAPSKEAVVEEATKAAKELADKFEAALKATFGANGITTTSMNVTATGDVKFGQAGATGVPSSANGLTKYSSSIADAVKREKTALASRGIMGVPNFAMADINLERSPDLVSSSNPAGFAITNSIDEKNGLRSLGMRSSGFIPNFAKSSNIDPLLERIYGPKAGASKAAKILPAPIQGVSASTMPFYPEAAMERTYPRGPRLSISDVNPSGRVLTKAERAAAGELIPGASKNPFTSQFMSKKDIDLVKAIKAGKEAKAATLAQRKALEEIQIATRPAGPNPIFAQTAREASLAQIGAAKYAERQALLSRLASPIFDTALDPEKKMSAQDLQNRLKITTERPAFANSINAQNRRKSIAGEAEALRKAAAAKDEALRQATLNQRQEAANRHFQATAAERAERKMFAEAEAARNAVPPSATPKPTPASRPLSMGGYGPAMGPAPGGGFSMGGYGPAMGPGAGFGSGGPTLASSGSTSGYSYVPNTPIGMADNIKSYTQDEIDRILKSQGKSPGILSKFKFSIPKLPKVNFDAKSLLGLGGKALGGLGIGASLYGYYQGYQESKTNKYTGVGKMLDATGGLAFTAAGLAGAGLATTLALPIAVGALGYGAIKGVEATGLLDAMYGAGFKTKGLAAVSSRKIRGLTSKKAVEGNRIVPRKMELLREINRYNEVAGNPLVSETFQLSRSRQAQINKNTQEAQQQEEAAEKQKQADKAAFESRISKKVAEQNALMEKESEAANAAQSSKLRKSFLESFDKNAESAGYLTTQDKVNYLLSQENKNGLGSFKPTDFKDAGFAKSFDAYKAAKEAQAAREADRIIPASTIEFRNRPMPSFPQDVLEEAARTGRSAERVMSDREEAAIRRGAASQGMTSPEINSQMSRDYTAATGLQDFPKDVLEEAARRRVTAEQVMQERASGRVPNFAAMSNSMMASGDVYSRMRSTASRNFAPSYAQGVVPNFAATGFTDAITEALKTGITSAFPNGTSSSNVSNSNVINIDGRTSIQNAPDEAMQGIISILFDKIPELKKLGPTALNFKR